MLRREHHDWIQGSGALNLRISETGAAADGWKGSSRGFFCAIGVILRVRFASCSASGAARIVLERPETCETGFVLMELKNFHHPWPLGG